LIGYRLCSKFDLVARAIGLLADFHIIRETISNNKVRHVKANKENYDILSIRVIIKYIVAFIITLKMICIPWLKRRNV
jgi:hypothetical protein